MDKTLTIDLNFDESETHEELHQEILNQEQDDRDEIDKGQIKAYLINNKRQIDIARYEQAVGEPIYITKPNKTKNVELKIEPLSFTSDDSDDNDLSIRQIVKKVKK